LDALGAAPAAFRHLRGSAAPLRQLQPLLLSQLALRLVDATRKVAA
jgi:hypothetical protein